jgi:hypothetical protein
VEAGRRSRPDRDRPAARQVAEIDDGYAKIRIIQTSPLYHVRSERMGNVMVRRRDRLREWEARFLVLRIAASFPHNEATTRQIKDAVPALIKLTTKDLEPSLTNPNECHWQEIIENVISSGKGIHCIFAKGYVIRLDDGIRVTPEGLAYLKMKGY